MYDNEEAGCNVEQLCFFLITESFSQLQDVKPDMLDSYLVNLHIYS